LSGRSHEIKGYTVATQVFGRGEDFNQATDPIVSIQANKLRRALERYYLVAGQNDPSASISPWAPMCRVSGNRPPMDRRAATSSKTNRRPIAPVPMRGRRSDQTVSEPDRGCAVGLFGDWSGHRTRHGNHTLPGNPGAADATSRSGAKTRFCPLHSFCDWTATFNVMSQG
jgi:hypothetical protein